MIIISQQSTGSGSGSGGGGDGSGKLVENELGKG